MTDTSLSWDLYRSFLAVLRTGSLSAAARSLGLTQPTLGRHIEAMEASLGTTLFIRSQTGFSPTEEALRLRSYSESMEVTVAALLREAASQTDGGTVRISASEIFGSEVLPPILTKIREKHPKIQLELSLSNRVENLLTREADIAVRMTEPLQGALIAKKLGDVEVGLHAHRRYLSRSGTPKRVEDLGSHSVIGFDKESAFIRSLRKKVSAFDRSTFAMCTDSDIAHLALIRAGFGIGFCQVQLAKRDKNLVRVLASEYQFKMGTWLVMHENLRLNSACKSVFTALAENLVLR